jgi:hypothetical protein
MQNVVHLVHMDMTSELIQLYICLFSVRVGADGLMSLLDDASH